MEGTVKTINEKVIGGPEGKLNEHLDLKIEGATPIIASILSLDDPSLSREEKERILAAMEGRAQYACNIDSMAEPSLVEPESYTAGKDTYVISPADERDKFSNDFLDVPVRFLPG